MKSGLFYSLERHICGWLLFAPPGERGVCMSVLDEVVKLIVHKGAVIDAGIARHYTVASPHTRVCVYAVAFSDQLAQLWRGDIEMSIASCSPQTRWWLGTDVGTSSASMFAVLSDIGELQCAARDYGKGSVPHDSDDFGRCVRLLKRFPEWQARLGEVANAYPNTAWPTIIARWNELEQAHPRRQDRILNECNEVMK